MKKILSSQEGNLPKKTLMTIITCDNEDNFPTLICNLQERQKKNRGNGN